MVHELSDSYYGKLRSDESIFNKGGSRMNTMILSWGIGGSCF